CRIGGHRDVALALVVGDLDAGVDGVDGTVGGHLDVALAVVVLDLDAMVDRCDGGGGHRDVAGSFVVVDRDAVIAGVDRASDGDVDVRGLGLVGGDVDGVTLR